MNIKCPALFVLVLLPCAYSANILMLPVPHYSYVNVMCIAGKALQDAGHKVTVILQDSQKSTAEKRGLQVFSYNLSDTANLPTLITKIITQDDGMWAKFKLMLSFKSTVNNLCQEIIENEAIKDGIDKGNFDLLFINNINMVPCMYALPYKYGLPYISIGPMSQPITAGVTVLPTNEPPPMMSTLELSFTGRLLAPLTGFLWEFGLPWYLTPSSTLSKLVPDREPTTTAALVANSTLFFTTLDTSCFGTPRVSAPNMVHMGSLSGKEEVQPLPEDLAKFPDSSSDGLILTTFGSMKSSKEWVIQHVKPIINALETVKENIIIQCDPDYFQGVEVPPNIMLRKWLPQNDLLAHRNTKLFINHGGQNGLMESVSHGVPVLVLSQQQEQTNNGKIMEWKTFGKLAQDTMDSILINKTVREIIDNSQYKESVQRCAGILRDLPEAKDKLVFWTNHVLKFGGSHLRLNSSDMPFHQMFMLDVLVVMLLSMIFMTYVFVKCVLKVYSRFFKFSKIKSKSD